MISLNNIELQFGDRKIFKNASFLINERDRIGLVGNNGAGKTTLLKVILGKQTPDSGVVQIPQDVTFGYLPQQMKHIDEKSLYNEVKVAFSALLNLEKKLSKLNTDLAERTDYESEAYLKLLNKINDYNSRLEVIGNENMEEKIEKVILGMGFSREDFDRPTNEFSGGWRMRIELAKILLQNPDVLLLDEPTNHLDIESIQWLENFLIEYPGAVILISHDRAFLDAVTNRTIEISLGNIYDYKVSYTKYVKLRDERREQQLAAYRNQQKFIEDTEQFIERFRYKATKAVQVQSRVKQLEKLERVEIDEDEVSAISIKFPPAPRSGTVVIEIDNLSKNYGDHVVLKTIDLTIERGERVAFVGRNGEGKTTLSKIIMSELDFEGSYKLGHNVKIGYFAQNQDELLDENSTVFDTIDKIAVGDIRTRIRGILGAFLFGGEDIDKKVKVLSGGERSRLALIKLLLEPYNLLVLDEPTNHLDMRSKDILKQALLDYNGTLIVVSHDRGFLDGLVEKIYEFRNTKLKEFTGSIFEFCDSKKGELLSGLNSVNNTTAIKTSLNENENISSNKQDYLERKELNKTIRKVENQIKKSEKKINDIESEMKEINALLSKPDANHDQALYQKYHTLEKALNNEMHHWENLNLELDEWKQK